MTGNHKANVTNWLREYGPSLGIAAALILIWQVVQANAGNSQYVLPPPSTIGYTIIHQSNALLRHMRPTLLEAAGGFLLGNGGAILLAAIFVYSRALEDAIYPLAVVLRSIPLIAITPIFVLWLGPGYGSKIAITTIIVFFPTLVNMAQGFVAVDLNTLEMMHTLDASEWYIFWKVRVPSSLPYFFSALKIAPAAAILGAIVAEFIGSTQGLGYLILQSIWNFRIDLLWATMIVAAALSIAAFVIVVVLERMVIPWHESVQEEEYEN